MFPKIEILQEKVQLYNNIAWANEHQGRLLSELRIFPVPQIFWDFEILGDEVAQKDRKSTESPERGFRGYRFTIANPIQTGDYIDLVTPGKGMSGKAYEADLGNRSSQGYGFRLFFPNTRFQAINLYGQEEVKTVHRIKDEEVPGKPGGKIINATLDEKWCLRLYISSEALAWLDLNKYNIGTQITAIGTLQSNMDSGVDSISYPAMSLEEVYRYSKPLSALLTFLNGGYISPVYIEVANYSDPKHRGALDAIALTPVITPLELIGMSWCTYDSDLPGYLSCFPVMQRMLSQPPWDEAFPLILSWYFQAIRPESITGAKQWQIVANAVETALERLGYTILVLEEGDPILRKKFDLLFSQYSKRAKKEWGLTTATSTTVKRLQLLLEKIGISLGNGFWDVNEVKSFIDLRNEATHPKKGTVDRKRIQHLLDTAIQWVYEILLWRLGYDGNYLIRTAPGLQSIPHRYDLSTRDPTW